MSYNEADTRAKLIDPALHQRGWVVDVDQMGLSQEQVADAQSHEFRTGRAMGTAELKAHYEQGDYERTLMLPERVAKMCQDLFQGLLETGGPEQKTIIFCTRDFHADMVAGTLNNLYGAWCQKHSRTRAEPYAFKCTAANEGNQYLPDFRASAKRSFIATTVDLLSTGVDVPGVRNIVFFRPLLSPILFYQMVGRGTRIDEDSGKLIFRLYDYTGVVDLFGSEFITTQPRGGGGGGGDGGEPPPIPVAPGVTVALTDQGRFILSEQGGRHVPIPLEQYKAELAQRLLAEAPTLEDFRARWVSPQERQVLMDLLVTSGYSPLAVQRVEGWVDCDLFDVLANVGYGAPTLTRQDRAAAFAQREGIWLEQWPEPAAATLKALVGQFEHGGTESLETRAVWEASRSTSGLPTVLRPVKAGADPARIKAASRAVPANAPRVVKRIRDR